MNKFKHGDKVKYVGESCTCGCQLETDSIHFVEQRGEIFLVKQYGRINESSSFILAVPEINEQKLKQALGLEEK